jgi:hypothetical protein
MVVIAFVCLGFLIGNLVGLSAQSTVAIILPLLFAFGGGSAIAFLPKLDAKDREQAAAAVMAMSLSCLVGVYSGILVSEYQILSPKNSPSRSRAGSIAEMKYLRGATMDKIVAIDQQFRTHTLTAVQALEQLHELVLEGDNDK